MNIMTRAEAAKRLGCTSAAIGVYARNKLLKEVAMDGTNMRYITEESLNEFVDKVKPTLDEYAPIEERMRIYLDQLEDEYEKSISELKYKIAGVKAQKDLVTTFSTGMISRLANRIISISPDMGDREKQLCYEILIGRSIATLAEEQGISDQRVRQIWSSACAKINRIHDETDRLREDNRRLNERIECQKQYIKELKSGKSHSQAIRNEIKLTSKLRSYKINKKQVSVRMFRVLERLKIETLYDLISVDEKSLFNARNCGKVTIQEFKDYVKDRSFELKEKLSIGMFNNKNN